MDNDRSKFDPVTVKNLMFLHQTNAAILVKEDPEEGGSNIKFWLPKSMLCRVITAQGESTQFVLPGNVLDLIERGDSLTVVIPKWLAVQKECFYE